MQFRFLAVAAVAVMLGGCGSGKPAPVREMVAAEKQGQFHTAFERARHVIDNPSDFSDTDVAAAQEVYDRVAPRISRSYATTIRQSIARGDIHGAVAAFETAQETVPMIVSDPEVLRLMMRAEVNRGDFIKAQQMAETLKAYATSNALATEAERFLDMLFDADELSQAIDRIRPVVEKAGKEVGATFESTLHGGTCTMAQAIDKLADADKLVVAEYLDLLSRRDALIIELIQLSPTPPTT